MFLLAGTFITNKLQVKSLHWHFSEASHGKGAPDGVGGCLKRTADSLVARGVDIPNIDILIRELEHNCKGIKLFQVHKNEVYELDKQFQNLELPKFKGILKVHEYTWTKTKKNEVSTRRLTCLSCHAETECIHYNNGKMHFISNTSSNNKSNQTMVDSEDSDAHEDPFGASVDLPHTAKPSSSKKESKQTLKVSDVYTSEESQSEEETTEPFKPMPYKFEDLTMGTYVIVSFPIGKNKRKRFLGVTQGQILPEREVDVMFFERCGNLSTFRANENDSGYISCDQIVGILPSPQMVTKGHRIFYKFRQNILL